MAKHKATVLPPWIAVDAANAVVTVDGIRYDRALFHALAMWPVGTVFRLARREPDMVELALVSCPTPTVLAHPNTDVARRVERFMPSAPTLDQQENAA